RRIRWQPKLVPHWRAASGGPPAGPGSRRWFARNANGGDPEIRTDAIADQPTRCYPRRVGSGFVPQLVPALLVERLIKMPTDQQLRTYAQSLPKIYREILAAFPRIEPNRKTGYGLAFQ